MYTEDGIPRRNPEGYLDLTAHEALTNAMELDNRVNKLIKVLKGMIEIAGFELVARIEIKDKDSGRVFR